MNKYWNLTKFGLVLFALPLVATAAASAHLQIVQSSPITVSTEAIAVEQLAIGLDRVHTVALNRNGGVDGRIVSFGADSNVSGLSELKVRFIKNGKTISQGMTDSDGVFSAQNIPEGIYSFIASGENGFAAYSVRVLSDSTGAYDDVMEAVAVPQIDSVQSIISTQSGSASTSAQSTSEKVAMDENGANRVVLKSGTLSGRVLLTTTGKHENTEVHILKDGTPFAKVMANENGEYSVPDMKPGVYALVAVGPQGVAVVAFEAVENSDTQVNNSSATITFVSTAAPAQEVTDMLNVYMVGPQDIVPEPIVGNDPIFEDGGFLPIEFAGENVVYGGAGGSFGPTTQTFATTGGGGGGGGAVFAGGRGRLLAIGGIVAGVVALSTSSNPSAISPATP